MWIEKECAWCGKKFEAIDPRIDLCDECIAKMEEYDYNEILDEIREESQERRAER